jgi:hypothetical protein
VSEAIVPMAPGERPTEPGWYVARRLKGDDNIIVSVWWDATSGLARDGRMTAQDIFGYRYPFAFITFIARIYPERIEGKEG